MISTTLSYKAVIAGKVCLDKSREHERSRFALRGRIAYLERDLAEAKKDSESYAKVNKALFDGNATLKSSNQSFDIAYTGLSSDFNNLQKQHR
jgi:hypothetical protein